jgi:ParB family transcriptional regulator, chromosome partitioning protein
MIKHRALGRGLAELIPATGPPREGERVEQIAVALIDPNPYQPRREFDPAELAELAASIKAQGLIQPITVRPSAGGRYEVVAGERRLRATRDLGATAIRAIVRVVDDRQLLELSLVENLLRADLNEIEVAEALQRLLNQYGYTTAQLAEVLGKSRPAVSNTLRLLELPEPVQELVRHGALSAGHGRAVLSFPAQQREEVAQTCAREGWSVREMERQSAQVAKREPVKRPRAKSAALPSAPAALKRAEAQLIEHLATRVRLSEQSGVGAITITYHGADDLQRLLEILLRGASPV